MLLINLLVLGAAQTATAQGELVVPPHRWTIDYSLMSCTLARRLGEQGSPILALNAALGLEPGELVIMDGGSGLDPRLDGDLAIRLDDDPPIAVRATRQPRNGRPVASLRPMPADFLARVAAARRLSVSKGNQVVLSLAVTDARAAIDALTRCNDDLLQSWGIDVAVRRALRTVPRIRSYEWASDIMPNVSTFLVFAADISERGEARGCRVVVSSRNARMDRALCDAVRSRARFEPALDSAGRPVPAQYVSRVRWTMDSD